MAPFAKEGRLVSKVFLAFVARQPCMARNLPTPCSSVVQCHHFPPKAMGGARHRDDRTIPLCSAHHEEAQQYRIPADVQEMWGDRVRSRFLETATSAEMEAFMADWKRWRQGRVFEEVEY